VSTLAEGLKTLPQEVLEGTNDWKRTGYGGPCPPIGRHRYFHKLYALDTVLPNLGDPTKAQLEKAMNGHILASAEIVGTYEKILRFPWLRVRRRRHSMELSIKKMCVVVTLMFFHSAWASAGTLTCGDASSTYQVTVDASRREGRVTKNLGPVRFGELSCAEAEYEGEAEGEESPRVFLVCRSKNVVDAGFYALFQDTGEELQVDLREVWFGGIRPLETVRCFE
jgi:hypothetical protein